MRKFAIPAIALAAASVALPSFAQQARAPQGPQHNQRPPAVQHHAPPAPQRPQVQPPRPAPQPLWRSVADRKPALERRINQAVQYRLLSNRQAQSLRSDLNALARKEVQDRRNGLTAAERRELDRRFDRLEARVPEPRGHNGRRY